MRGCCCLLAVLSLLLRKCARIQRASSGGWARTISKEPAGQKQATRLVGGGVCEKHNSGNRAVFVLGVSGVRTTIWKFYMKICSLFYLFMMIFVSAALCWKSRTLLLLVSCSIDLVLYIIYKEQAVLKLLKPTPLMSWCRSATACLQHTSSTVGSMEQQSA